MGKLGKIIGTGAAAVLLVLGTTTAAQAGTTGPQVCNSIASACAKFYHDGDVMRVWDTACDGRAAVAHVWSNQAGLYVNLWNTGGCDTYADYAFGTDIPEGSLVYYQACRGIKHADGTYEQCSGVVNGTA